MTDERLSGPPQAHDAARASVVWLAASVRESMLAEAASKYPNETGGVLLGYADPTTCATVVAVAAGPGPNAIHSPTSFVPDHAFQADEIARIYAWSGRRYAYLGDWHCHPRTSAYLSATDAETLERIAAAPRARAARPLMIVLGQHAQDLCSADDPQAWYIEAWQFVRARSAWGRLRGSRPSERQAARCHVIAFEQEPQWGMDSP